jgi:hypothetical protein
LSALLGIATTTYYTVPPDLHATPSHVLCIYYLCLLVASGRNPKGEMSFYEQLLAADTWPKKALKISPWWFVRVTFMRWRVD